MKTLHILTLVRVATTLLLASVLRAQTEPRATGESVSPTTPNRGYPLRGIVTDVLTKKNLILIAHEDIPGFLPAMTRAFQVPPDVFSRLRPGTRLAATLLDQAPDGWHLAKVRLLLENGQTLEPNVHYCVALTADPKHAGSWAGNLRFKCSTAGDWRVCVSAGEAWVEVAPGRAAPLTAQSCSHATPAGFVKAPLYLLASDQPYEIRFTKVPAAELDVLILPAAP